jgi:K+ transporter
MTLLLSPLFFIPLCFSSEFGLPLTSEFLMGVVSIIVWSAMIGIALLQCLAWWQGYKTPSIRSADAFANFSLKPWALPLALLWGVILHLLGWLSLYQMPGVLGLVRWQIVWSFLLFKPFQAIALFALFTILFISAWRVIPRRLGCYFLISAVCLNFAGQLSLVMRDPSAAANPMFVLLLSAANTLRVSP